MARDYFALLGLSPGRYDPREITRRFQLRRARLVGELDDTSRYADVRQELDELHLAYAALCAARTGDDADADPHAQLRALIAASLEDGLLRCSRRQRILQAARELGVSDFHAQLLIAQVQFGEPAMEPVVCRPVRPRAEGTRIVARVAGVGALAAAIFLMLVRWMHS